MRSLSFFAVTFALVAPCFAVVAGASGVRGAASVSDAKLAVRALVSPADGWGPAYVRKQGAKAGK